jgi:hypothetical protein
VRFLATLCGTLPCVPKYADACPSCDHWLEAGLTFAGMADRGFMYCDRDSTLLTWEAYDPLYRQLAERMPWTLDAYQQASVESWVPACPCGGSFRFTNPPRCPSCHRALPQEWVEQAIWVGGGLIQPPGSDPRLPPVTRVFYLILGRQIHGTQSWTDPGAAIARDELAPSGAAEDPQAT